MLGYLLLALTVAAASAATIPEGTELSIRLATKVGSKLSKVNDSVEAHLIAPVVASGQVVLASGAKVRGKVKHVSACSTEAPRAVLGIDFEELEAAGQKTKLSAKVVKVDNARESVDAETGQIVGILGSETFSARMDQGIGKVAQRFSGLAEILQAAKTAVVKESDPEIEYEPGVELMLSLTKNLTLDAKAAQTAPVGSINPEDELVRLVNAQPFQTTAENPPKPSDVTNLMYIGSEQALTKAFAAAGWSTAAALSGQSKMETFRAIVESRGYKEAPMSILLLEGKPPALTFQKQNNTFAMRHHLRIWRRPDLFQGKPLWVCAATHDIGIEFSPENRTFIHKIDSNIDRERAKVVSDLLHTGLVRGLALVERPAVPKQSMNATGDKLETDAAMAVLLLE